MQTLLRIDSSLREKGSHGRMYGDRFVALWKDRNPGSMVRTRDLAKIQIPHLTQEVASAFFGPDWDASPLETSNELCAELMASDALLIVCPTYNLGIPSTLKAYFDHIVRTKVTFRNEGREYKGLLENKKAYLICSMGDKKQNPNVLEPFEAYLHRILNFMGIHDIKTLSVHGTSDPKFIEGQKAHYIKLLNQLI